MEEKAEVTNYDRLKRQGESVGRYHTRLLIVSHKNGCKVGNMYERADYIINERLVDVFESYNPVREPVDDFNQLNLSDDSDDSL